MTHDHGAVTMDVITEIVTKVTIKSLETGQFLQNLWFCTANFSKIKILRSKIRKICDFALSAYPWHLVSQDCEAVRERAYSRKF